MIQNHNILTSVRGKGFSLTTMIIIYSTPQPQPSRCLVAREDWVETSGVEVESSVTQKL